VLGTPANGAWAILLPVPTVSTVGYAISPLKGLSRLGRGGGGTGVKALLQEAANFVTGGSLCCKRQDAGFFNAPGDSFYAAKLLFVAARKLLMPMTFRGGWDTFAAKNRGHRRYCNPGATLTAKARIRTHT
jgi:hypothetical protein